MPRRTGRHRPLRIRPMVDRPMIMALPGCGSNGVGPFGPASGPLLTLVRRRNVGARHICPPRQDPALGALSPGDTRRGVEGEAMWRAVPGCFAPTWAPGRRAILLPSLRAAGLHPFGCAEGRGGVAISSRADCSPDAPSSVRCRCRRPSEPALLAMTLEARLHIE